MKSKLYISSSKMSNPRSYTLIKGMLSETSNWNIKEFTGGNFDSRDTDDCQVILIIPPTDTIVGELTLTIGRGQSDIINRALSRNQKVIMHLPGSFYGVSSIHVTEKNWKDDFATVTCYRTGFTNDLEKKLHQWYNDLNDPTLKAIRESKSTNDGDLILASELLFPHLFKK